VILQIKQLLRATSQRPLCDSTVTTVRVSHSSSVAVTVRVRPQCGPLGWQPESPPRKARRRRAQPQALSHSEGIESEAPPAGSPPGDPPGPRLPGRRRSATARGRKIIRGDAQWHAALRRGVRRAGRTFGGARRAATPQWQAPARHAAGPAGGGPVDPVGSAAGPRQLRARCRWLRRRKSRRQAPRASSLHVSPAPCHRPWACHRASRGVQGSSVRRSRPAM
jgi:hypothetical protein